MGANPTQAMGCALFLLAFTLLSAGIFKGSVVLYLLAAVSLVISIAVLHKCKPLEYAEN
jgi:hypothetical protein